MGVFIGKKEKVLNVLEVVEQRVHELDKYKSDYEQATESD